jgi:integrase
VGGRRGQLEEDGEESGEGSISPGNVLSWDELESLLSAARTDFPGAYPLLAFMADTGARLGEACALRWADVDLEQGVARIARSYSSGRYLAKTKTGKPRPVELSARVREALAAERPHIFGSKALVFPNEAGDLINPHNFRGRIFRKLVEKVLGEDRRFTPHGLRHTFASLHLARGTNVKWVQQQGGWASAKVLLDTYAHCIPGESTGYADAIAEEPIRRETAVEAGSPAEPVADAREADALPQREIA